VAFAYCILSIQQHTQKRDWGGISNGKGGAQNRDHGIGGWGSDIGPKKTKKGQSPTGAVVDLPHLRGPRKRKPRRVCSLHAGERV